MRKLRPLVIYALIFLLTCLTSTPVSAAKKTYIAPTATNVSISGTPAIGKTLTGSYTYYDAGGIPQGASTYKWLYSSSLTGTYYAISGVTAKTYTLTSNDSGHYIKFQVTPVASRGYPDTGSSVLSTAVGPVAAPVSGSIPEALNVRISGNTAVGQVLTGVYTYYDKDGDLEGNSTYRWLSSVTADGTYTAVSGGTARTYTLASSDAGSYFKFEVTPISATGTPNIGTSVQSTVSGPVATPSVSRVIMGFAVKSYATDVSSYNSTTGAGHTIWFENDSSIGYKSDLINQNNLLGAGIWKLGLEDTAYWNTINTKFVR